ncbi:MAG: DUF871 domain-containing protein [Mycoplasmataceae bacterium]|nr:DUF871 domain-containing protein [Mycoplasmataceae bacterium]
MLGISVYPEKAKKQEVIEYINLAAKYGFKRVFTCLLSAEGTKEEIKNEFYEIITSATKKGMEVVLDIAPSVFTKLEISYDDLSFFKELGATGIRLDEGFNGLKEAEMTFNKLDLDIEINMSSGTKYVDNIISFEPNRKKLIGCHNFYPMEYSGLSLETFELTSKQFQDLRIRSAAFVTSNSANHGPWPVMDGLCTLEMHRKLPITTQVKHLMMLGLVDDIIIGNAFASEAELKAISEISQIIPLDIKFDKSATEIEKKIVLDELHFNRGDRSDYLIRSTQSRVKYKDNDFKPLNTQKEIKKGSIAIGNDNFGQYKGELHLVKKDHSDEKGRKNIVAQIKDYDLFLLDFIKPWTKFSFKEVK